MKEYQASEEIKEIITKQIVMTPNIYYANLVPVTADKKYINQIQDYIDKLEKLLELYRRRRKLEARLTNLNHFRKDYETLNAQLTQELDQIESEIKELE